MPSPQYLRRPWRPLVAAFLLAVLGCASKEGGHGATGKGEGNSAAPAAVVATTGLIADALRALLPESQPIVALMGPGTDPHLYKASAGDLARLSQARLIVLNGLHLEGKMADVLGRLAARKPVLALADSLPTRRLQRSAQGTADPHIWFDVGLWRQAVLGAVAPLARALPEHADSIRRRADAYAARLDSLEAWVSRRLASLPLQRRLLVTAHDAFGYFGAAYGLEVHALQGISTAAEYGLADVRSLADLIVARRVPAIFVESSLSPRSIEAVLEACCARGHAVRLGGTLYSDALGAEGTPQATYEGMVRHNVNTIVAALGGPPEARGRAGAPTK